MNDEEYVRLCLGGRPEMFRHLVVLYESALIKHLTGRLRDPNEAAEAAQEAIVRSYFALSRLKKAASFFPWLLGIADRVASEVRRRRRLQADLRLTLTLAPAPGPARSLRE